MGILLPQMLFFLDDRSIKIKLFKCFDSLGLLSLCAGINTSMTTWSLRTPGTCKEGRKGEILPF